mgnify:CR=1 FL=1
MIKSPETQKRDDDWDTYFARLSALAKQKGRSVKGDFNFVDYEVRPKDTAQSAWERGQEAVNIADFGP